MEPKTKVFVKSLKQEGTILEKRPNGLYKIAIGVMQSERPEKDLKAIAESVEDKRLRAAFNPTLEKKAPHEIKRAEAPIDLHGMRVDEALQALAQKLDEALLADVDRVAVIHGLGTGALLTAVHKLLKEQPTVKHFKVEQGNPGTTWLYF